MMELQDLHESIVLDDAYFSSRNLSGKGRNVVPTAKQRRDVQVQAALLRFSSLASSRRKSAGSSAEELSMLDSEDRMLAEMDLTLKPRTYINSGSLILHDPDKLLRRNVRRQVVIFSDLVIVAGPKDNQDVYDVQQVLNVKDLKLRHSAGESEEERLAFDLIVVKTRSRPQSELRFVCDDDSSWRQWVEDLENTLLAFHRQTEMTKQLGWFHDVIQGNVYSAAYLGDAALFRRHIKRLTDPRTKSAVTIDTPDASGMSALHWAVMRGHDVCARLLLDRGAEVDVMQKGMNTPLLLAAASGDENICRLLIDRGADLNTLNHRGFDAVFMAVLCGHQAKGLPWLLQLLHTKGMDLNRTDRSGATPLHLCAERNLARPVRMLVDAGADVNARHAKTQLTPLQMACSSRHPDVETMRSFLDKGAYPNWRDLQGRTAFDLALRSLPSASSGVPGPGAQAPQPVIFSSGGAVDINEVLLSPGGKSRGEEDGTVVSESVDSLASAAQPNERWRAMEATLQVVGDWVVRTLPALLELSKKGARFDPTKDLSALRPSVRSAVWEAKELWEKKTQPENFLAFVRTREMSGEDLRLHRNGWSKDEASNICQLCSDGFSLTNRRHHCRACGVLCCDKCSSKRMHLTAAKAEAAVLATSGSFSSPSGSGSGKEKKKDDGTERVCDGCFNRLLHEASLPSLDHFRIRQLKKCALDVVQSVQQFIEELDGAEAEAQGNPMRDILAMNSLPGVGPSPVTTPLQQRGGSFRLATPASAASRASMSPMPNSSSNAADESIIIQLIKQRQGQLLGVENVVAKFLEVSPCVPIPSSSSHPSPLNRSQASAEYHKISKKLIEQKVENGRLWGGANR